MATTRQWLGVARALRRRTKVRLDRVVMLDTALGSENSGDHIIMDACDAVCSEVFGDVVPLRLATHYYTPESEDVADAIKVLCGTNILYTHMARQEQWSLPRDLHAYQNTVLLGVGMSDIGIDDPIDAYSRALYRALLSPNAYHSVRDGFTKGRLEDIGIKNVLNTSCPTLWELTRERQARVPAKRSTSVLTSVTDYCFSAERDGDMLGILGERYEHVAIWVQGSHDVDWCLRTIVDLDDYELVGPGIERLNAYVASREFDYVGTRLHAGIRCLLGGHRALVVAIDNRARAIAADTNLPVVERDALGNGALERWIACPEPLDMTLPEEEIALWKAQFTRFGRWRPGHRLRRRDRCFRLP